MPGDRKRVNERNRSDARENQRRNEDSNDAFHQLFSILRFPNVDELVEEQRRERSERNYGSNVEKFARRETPEVQLRRGEILFSGDTKLSSGVESRRDHRTFGRFDSK